jgi:hypothetical protein
MSRYVPPRHLSVNEVAQLCRCRPDTIRIAVVCGALHAFDRGPGQRGRSPRYLIPESDAIAWLSAGRPFTIAR